ncbi:sortase [Gallintestinimicrobium sp.]|uniref:sortase n=1 Tax=Gallintestinimicrobium sp. TaxID=2981655 RepID=UPI003994A6FF
MKGRKIRIRQGVKGWLLALAMVLSLCSGWKQDVCAQQSQSSSSNLMQDVDTDKKGSIEILFDTMRDEPVANAEFTLYQVAAMVDRGGYTVLELTGGFEGSNVQLKNLTAQQSKGLRQHFWSIRKQITFPGIRKRLMQTESSAGQGCRPVCICWFRADAKWRTDPSLVSILTNLNAQLLYDMSVNPRPKEFRSVSAGRIETSTPEVKSRRKRQNHRYTGITPEQKTPEKLPQTGQLRWLILALSAVGPLLFLGWWIGRKKKDCSKALMGLGILLAAGAVGISAYNIWDSSRAEAAVEASLEAYEEELTAVEQESEVLPVDENSGMTFVEADGLCWIGELEIPSLQLTLPVADPWSYPSLKKAPCRYTGSAEENSLIIAAHNYKRHFGNIGLLPEGATVKFTAVSGDVYEYEVEKVETLNPYAVDEMLSGDWDLTLFTCTYGGRKRVTVRCSLVG